MCGCVGPVWGLICSFCHSWVFLPCLHAVSVSACLLFCYRRLRCHRSCGLIHTVRQTPTPHPPTSSSSPHTAVIIISVCWSNTPPCVQRRAAETWKLCLSRGRRHRRWTGVLSVSGDSQHHHHNRMCDPGESGRDRRLIVALWCWSWESSLSKSDKIWFLLWLLCQPFWIICLKWATLHTESHGYGCVVSSRHQPRPSGGAVGEGGEGWQLPGERQRVGAWSLCTLLIVSIWKSQTAQVNRNTYLWH